MSLSAGLRNEEEDLINFDEKFPNEINISYLLLYRAISGCQRLMSRMLHKLLAYPVENFPMESQGTGSIKLLEKLKSE